MLSLLPQYEFFVAVEVLGPCFRAEM